MRYAIISDIHSNLEALTMILEKIDREEIDKIICLGDLVGYFANPNECLNLIREHNIQCIAGNHDRVASGFKKPIRFKERGKRAIYWTRKQLTADNIRLLEKLPLIETIDHRFLIVHGSLHPEPNEDIYLLSKTEILKDFEVLTRDHFKANICFFGHTHLSIAYEYYKGLLSKIESSTFKLKPSAYYMINPGSVGKSHNNGDPRASFIIYDSDKETVQYHRVMFDWSISLEKARQNGLLYEGSLIYKSTNRIRGVLSVGKRTLKRALLR